MPTTARDAALSAAELPGPDRHLPFYGLASPPFRSGADPGRLWLGNAHRAILDTLARAIRDGNGIAVLTGDAGTGKTSLAQRFIAMLGPAGISVGRVSRPGQAPSDFFEAVLSAYGVRRPVHDKDTFAACIRTVLARAAARGDKVLLVVDEAQGLGHELLCEVADLSALAAASGHPLFILLVGETRLTAALKDDQHAALRERIIARCAVPPLGPDEVSAYVRHYLDAAGAVTEIFSPEAIRTIASLSRGAPGAINIIGDRALLVGRARRARPITEAIVADCGRSPASPSAVLVDFDRSSPRATAMHSSGKGRGRLYVTITATALLVTGAPYLAWWLMGLGDNSSRTASDDVSRLPHAPVRDEAPPVPAVVTRPPADAPSSPVPSGDADRALPERRAPVSAAPIEAHAAIPARPTASRPRAAVPRESPATRESSVARESAVPREIRPPAVTPRPPAPVAATPGRVAAPEVTSSTPRAPEGSGDTPDPSAIIDWLMKESPARRPGG
jgi:type II secretory pathway predicted ATPase ExeA